MESSVTAGQLKKMLSKKNQEGIKEHYHFNSIQVWIHLFQVRLHLFSFPPVN